VLATGAVEENSCLWHHAKSCYVYSYGDTHLIIF